MNLERLILEKLNQVAPRLLSQNVLWSDCRLEDSSISLTSVKDALRKLESKDQVTVVPGEDSTKVKIKPAGIARLAE